MDLLMITLSSSEPSSVVIYSWRISLHRNALISPLLIPVDKESNMHFAIFIFTFPSFMAFNIAWISLSSNTPLSFSLLFIFISLSAGFFAIYPSLTASFKGIENDNVIIWIVPPLNPCSNADLTTDSSKPVVMRLKEIA